MMGWRRYWHHTGAKWGGMRDLVDAVKASASMRHLGGDSASDVISAPGCPNGDDQSSNLRRIYHQLTMYGFLLCLPQHRLVRSIIMGLVGGPLWLFRIASGLGTVGGIILCIGTAGLFFEKRRLHPAVKHESGLGMDYAFIVSLFLVSFTGLYTWQCVRPA